MVIALSSQGTVIETFFALVMTHSPIKSAQAWLVRSARFIIGLGIWLVTAIGRRFSIGVALQLPSQAAEEDAIAGLDQWMSDLQEAIAEAQSLQGKVLALMNAGSPLQPGSLALPSQDILANELTDTSCALSDQIRRLHSDVDSLSAEVANRN